MFYYNYLFFPKIIYLFPKDYSKIFPKIIYLLPKFLRHSVCCMENNSCRNKHIVNRKSTPTYTICIRKRLTRIWMITARRFTLRRLQIQAKVIKSARVKQIIFSFCGFSSRRVFPKCVDLFSHLTLRFISSIIHSTHVWTRFPCTVRRDNRGNARVTNTYVLETGYRYPMR